MSERASGTILEGKYEILERLGGGGMGEVYRARHVHLHEQRVVKILRQDRADDPTATQRFTQEARIATQIKHPNVAILYDFSRLPDGSFYMVWEHIEGEDVGGWLKSKGPFPIALAVELGIQALRGLEAIHAAGVIHRDISPDNFMISRDRRGRYLLKIIDLGLAKTLDTTNSLEITQAGMFMGKLMYCSPEQAGSIAGAALDHRSDLYSFAAVLYEMIAGQPPFDSENQHGFVLKRLSEPPVPLAGRNPHVHVPRELNAVVLKGLEKDRNRRFPDAISFLQALVKVAEDLRRVATQEVELSQVKAAIGRDAPVPPHAVSGSERRPSTGELSKEERIDLLAQIDRAAKRVSESTRLADVAERAFRDLDWEEARRAIDRLETTFPKFAGLGELRERLDLRAATPAVASAPSPAAEPPASAQPQPPPAAPGRSPSSVRTAVPQAAGAIALDPELAGKIAEAETLLDRYLQERKRPLAELALETLVDLAPDHPRRKDYEDWVGLLSEESGKLKKAEAAERAGRESLVRGDLGGAKRQLEQVERFEGTSLLSKHLRAEIEQAEKSAEATAELDRRRDRLEQLLSGRRMREAEEELKRLTTAGLSRVSIESYRLRVADLQALAERESTSSTYERRYRELAAQKDWNAARALAIEFETAIPDSPRPAELYAELSHAEDQHRREQGVAQGLKQLETFLVEKRPQEAAMALRVLLQLDPQLPQRTDLERRVRALGG